MRCHEDMNIPVGALRGSHLDFFQFVNEAQLGLALALVQADGELQRVSLWGNSPCNLTQCFAMKDCWGLRQGSLHEVCSASIWKACLEAAISVCP